METTASGYITIWQVGWIGTTRRHERKEGREERREERDICTAGTMGDKDTERRAKYGDVCVGMCVCLGVCVARQADGAMGWRRV